MRKRPNPPNPPSLNSPHLRLARTEPRAAERSASPRAARPVSYKFPGTAAANNTNSPDAWRRPDRPERLVAARVDRAPVERRFTGSDSPCALVHDPDIDDPDRAGRIVSSRDLVRQIESTLDRMQSRLEDFRTQMDEAFKFPVQAQDDDEPDRPRAA